MLKVIAETLNSVFGFLGIFRFLPPIKLNKKCGVKYYNTTNPPPTPTQFNHLNFIYMFNFVLTYPEGRINLLSSQNQVDKYRQMFLHLNLVNIVHHSDMVKNHMDYLQINILSLTLLLMVLYL